MGRLDEGEVRVCSDHQDYQVPLLWTFAFPGAEYWCPYCGHIHGMLGAGTIVLGNQDILERGHKYKEMSKDFLISYGTENQLEWKYFQKVDVTKAE